MKKGMKKDKLKFLKTCSDEVLTELHQAGTDFAHHGYVKNQMRKRGLIPPKQRPAKAA